ncbi:MAG: efflux RND transporter permease subunit [Balneolaceae bacterium]|nr:efflux RND transporter permease subunit [Balneolaceae bacterium]
MRSLIQYFTKHVVLVNLGILLFILFGVLAASSLTSTFFPNRTVQFIIVEAVYPGASPIEIEEGVVLKIEESLEGTKGVDRVTSVSQENFATVRVELLPDQDPNVVLQEVKNAVDRISSFPVGLERVVVFKEEPFNQVGEIALVGDVTPTTLKSTIDAFEDALLAYDGLSQLQLSGFTEPEIQIGVSEDALRAYGLTFADISRAVASSNVRITGGILRGERREFTIRVDEQNYYAKGFNDIVVKSDPNGTIVKLSDVATVEDTFDENTNKGYLDGKPAVFIFVTTTNEEDILAASAFIKNYIDEFNAENSRVEAVLVDDATISLVERIELLRDNGLLGVLLVFILLGLFLRIRLAFWVALGIPISFLGMFVLASFYGITINVISLFGMIVVIGILVDDGIVVGENIYQKYEEGMHPLKAAVEGTMEVVPSVTSAILTTSIAFSFFFFVDGQLGDFFSEIAFVVAGALLVSLIEVFLFLPAHLAHSKDLHKDPEKEDKSIQHWLEQKLFYVRDELYVPFLRFTLQNKTFMVLTAIGLLLITFGAIAGGYVKTTFFPNIEQNAVTATLEMPQGTSEAVTELRVQQIREGALRLNEQYKERTGDEVGYIRNIVTKLGPGSNKASINFYLIPSEERDIQSFDISLAIKEEVGAIPDATLLSFVSQNPFGKPVSVSLAADNFQELRSAKEMLIAEMQKLDILRDITDTDNEDQPEIQITLKDRAYALGFTNLEVIGQVRNAFFGNEVQRLQRGTTEVKVWTRYLLEDRRDISQLLDMRIRSASGGSYPLRELADIEFTNGLVAINHRDGKREIRVEAELANLDVSGTEALNKVENVALPPVLAAHPNVTYQFEGQVRETQKAANSARFALPAILILLFSIVTFTFRSFIQAIVLYCIVPFGIIGMALGHYIHGFQISLLSFLGFVALIGILVNDGLVFINAFNNSIRQGKDVMESLIETGRSRFRPILLTTATTCAGLAPLIFEKSFQAQFLIPMAITIAYGLLVGTFLLLSVLPAFLLIANTIRLNTKWLRTWAWTGEKLTIKREEVEPAYIETEWEKENE